MDRSQRSRWAECAPEEQQALDDGAALEALLAKSPPSLPALPQAVRELMVLAASPALDVRQVSKIVSRDPSLAADMLRRANAAAFGGRRPVYNLTDATVRVGDRGVRDVIAAALAGRVLVVPNQPDITMMLTVRAAAVGATVGVLALQAGVPAGDSWTAALVADVGWIVGFAVVREQRARLPIGLELNPKRLRAAIAGIHARIGGKLLAAWAVPEALHAAVAAHHEPDAKAPGCSLASRLYVAGRVADRLGACPEAPVEPAGSDPHLVQAGFDEAKLRALGRSVWPTLRAQGLVAERKRQATPWLRVERRAAVA